MSATDGNKAMAQNMALELAYDAYNQTNDGERTYWKPCPVCGVFIGGKNDVNLNNKFIHKNSLNENVCAQNPLYS